jgi:hypothetical protein
MPLPTIFVSIWLISLWLYFRRGRSVRRALVIGMGKGHVDLAAGLYLREDDDFIVSESPAFVWLERICSD